MSWLVNNVPQILQLALAHIALSVPPILIGFALSIPFGWLAHRFTVTRGVLLTVLGLLYTIPSLAILVLLPTIIGYRILSSTNVVVALSIYALALMVRSVADALDAVDPDVKQSATAVGFSSWRRFWTVEFPLAGPVMLAGLRVVAVSTVSLVTVGIFVGVQSLGYFFVNGLQRNIPVEIATGIVLTVVIALVFDGILVLLGRALMPWARLGTRRRAARRALVQAASR